MPPLFADGFRSWQIINLVMFGVGVAAFFLLLAVKIPDISTDKNIKPTTYMSIIKNPAFFLLILMCGFFIYRSTDFRIGLPLMPLSILDLQFLRARFLLDCFMHL